MDETATIPAMAKSEVLVDQPEAAGSPPTGRSGCPLGPDRIALLDCLRGLAIALVLWSHLPAGTAWLESARSLIRPGYLGVDIFFVLSGFLITRILLHDSTAGRPISGFLVRRALRIFPIYYLALAIVAFWRPGSYLLWNAFYLQNFVFTWPNDYALSHTWSLAVEEHFYLVWPAIIYFAPRRHLGWIMAGTLALSVIAALTITIWGGENAVQLVYRGTPARMGSLAAGALLAWHEQSLRRWMWWLVPALAVTAGGLAYVPTAEARWERLVRLYQFGAISTGIVLLGLMVNRALAPDGKLGIAWQPLAWLGTISYGLYLYHLPLYGVIGMETPLRCATAVAIAIGVAAASYYTIESPLLRLKDRFR